MITKFLKNSNTKFEINIPEENFLYYIEPANLNIKINKISIMDALKKPLFSKPLSKLVKSGMKMVILVDDLTRPTPQKKILPILLSELNKIGIEDKDITIIIALGTHRYMTESEIIKRFSKKIFNKLNIINHEWKNKDTFIDLGFTKNNTPIIVNKKVYEADFVIGVGIIATHDLAGWSGGCKIIQPGVCSFETTQATHLLAGRGDIIANLGKVNNNVRKEIENVAIKVGLDFIINVVLDSDDNILNVFCGDPIKAHRAGVKYIKPIYERNISGLADIVIANAYPSDLDYWQGVKSLLLAQKGVKVNGTIILIGDFQEGISSTHIEYREYGNRSSKEIDRLYSGGKINDKVCAASLMIHSKCVERTKVICISTGLSKEDKSSLNFINANTIEEALKIAFIQQGKNAKIGIIEYGGDVIPILNN